MKRIFLTSGLVLCMACPAFAEGSGYGIETGPQAGQCDYTHLGSYSDPVTLTAQWTSTVHEITLDPNPQDNSENYLYGSGANSTMSPTVLYKAADGTYLTQTPIQGTNPQEYSYTNELDSGDTVCSGQSPAGQLITLRFDPNYTAINALNDGDDYSSGVSAVSNETANRAFAGFFAQSDTTGETALINSSCQITSDGLGVTNTTQTWEAHYGCATPAHAGTPSLTGYHFDGWVDSSDNPIENWCFDSDTTVYASWSQNTHSVTYYCPQPGTSTQSGTVPTADSGVPYDDNYTVKANTCAFQGWAFAGWNCTYNIAAGTANANVGESDVAKATATANQQPGSVWFHTDADVTCYATWTRGTIALTWKDGTNATGGNQITEGVAGSCYYDDAITLPANPTRPGYEFTGWAVSPTPQQGNGN